MLTKTFYTVLLLTLCLFVSCFRTNLDNTTSENNDNKNKANLFNYQTFKLTSVEDLYQFLTYRENSYPLVSAHRGGPTKGYPENAIETFENIADKMPAIIECDVRLSKDSILILMHDETLDRTTTGTGKVNKYTLSELKQLKLKDNVGKITSFKIPTLEEALIWGNGKVIFTLDAKNDIPYKLLSKTILKANAQSFSIVITYNAKQAKALYNINSDLMISTSINTGDDLNRLADLDIPDNRLVAFVGLRQPKKELVDLLHQHGIKIILGTLGNLDKQAESKGYQIYADYIVNGADIISTDRPFEAQKALDYYIRKRNITSPYIKN